MLTLAAKLHFVCVRVCFVLRVYEGELESVGVHVLGVPWSVWASSGCGGGQWGAVLL